MKTLLVTGIGGFLGLRVAAEARARGYDVRGIDASEAAVARAREAGFTAAFGDITAEASMREAMRGVDAVVHTAAVVEEGGSMELFTRVNVGGTAIVAGAAAQAGVRRFVHVSSVMVYGFDYPPLVEEDGPLAHGETNPYCATKLASEAEALRHHGAMKVVVLRPADIYGAGSVPWILRPLALMRARLFALPSEAGVLNPVYVDDVAQAAGLALTTEATGTAFTITGGLAVGCDAYFGRLAAWLGQRWVPRLPARVLRSSLAALAVASRIVGRRPPALPEGVDYLLRPAAYSGRRAAEGLGFHPATTLDAGLRATHRALSLDVLGLGSPASRR